jgi:GNAT superfamily N-acetyltransferase
MKFTVKTLEDDPSLRSRIGELEDDSFPRFLNEEPTWIETQDEILTAFARTHYFVLEEGTGKLAGLCINVPFAWTGEVDDLPGYNELLRRCLNERHARCVPTALAGILGAVAPEYQSQGVSRLFFGAAAAALEKLGLRNYLSPVRPSNKQSYPNFSIDDFLSWRTPEGELVDPWLASFVRGGSKMLGIAREAITMSASCAQWSAWTGMRFPVSGDYVIPGGHRLLEVDAGRGVGRYAEDHVWFDILLPRGERSPP